MDQGGARGAVAPLPIADLHVGLGELDCELGDLAEATRHLETAKALGESAATTESRHRWFLAMARVHAGAGDREAAIDLLSQAERRYRRGFLPRGTADRPLDASTITTAEVTVRSTAKLVMAALALAGITGIYLRQVRQAGVLGLVGYLLFAAFYLVLILIEFTAAYVLPSLADTEPSYVNDVIAATGGTANGDIGLLPTAFLLSGVLYIAGGLTFGIAMFRARVLARWAAALVAVGAVATLALAVLPQSFNRPFAVPTGVALIGLGISLSREQRGTSHESGSSRPGARLDTAGAQ